MTAVYIDGATPGSIRGHNRGLVMKRVFEAGRISRTQIAVDTGLTAAAISRITRELLELNLIEEGPPVPEKGRPGRRSIELSICSSGSYVIGIGAGAFEQSVQIATLRGDAIAHRSLELIGLDEKPAADAIIDGVTRLIKDSGLRSSTLVACGAAVAGVVDPDTGTVITSPNFGWEKFPLKRILENELDVQTAVESLHHALNLAEARQGSVTSVGNILLVNAALGIGASILADGKIFRGGGRAAGQIGHMRVEGAREICTCGRRGCLDTVASGHAVLTRLGLISPREQRHEHEPGDSRLLREVMKKAEAGDSAAQAAFKTAGRNLGKALTAVRMVTDPERIVLAGPMAQVSSYVDAVRGALFDNQTDDHSLPVLLVSNQENDAAGTWLALERFVFSDRLDPSTFKIL